MAIRTTAAYNGLEILFSAAPASSGLFTKKGLPSAWVTERTMLSGQSSCAGWNNT